MRNIFWWFWERTISLRLPWEAIILNPAKFISWFLAVPVIGLTGFWLPILLIWGYGGDLKSSVALLLHAGTTAVVCVAIIGEGVYAMVTADKSGSNKTALGIRGIVIGWSFVLVIILIGIVTSDFVLSPVKQIHIWLHVLWVIIAIITGCYLYCFRDSSWEKHLPCVDEAIAAENAEIEHLSDSVNEPDDVGGLRL
jgi:hypothetical protein